MRVEQTSQAVTKPSGFYIERTPGEKPSKFYIVHKDTQEATTKKPGRFFIEHLPGKKPSKFYIEAAQVVYSLRAKKRDDEEQAA